MQYKSKYSIDSWIAVVDKTRLQSFIVLAWRAKRALNYGTFYCRYKIAIELKLPNCIFQLCKKPTKTTWKKVIRDRCQMTRKDFNLISPSTPQLSRQKEVNGTCSTPRIFLIAIRNLFNMSLTLTQISYLLQYLILEVS